MDVTDELARVNARIKTLGMLMRTAARWRGELLERAQLGSRPLAETEVATKLPGLGDRAHRALVDRARSTQGDWNLLTIRDLRTMPREQALSLCKHNVQTLASLRRAMRVAGYDVWPDVRPAELDAQALQHEYRVILEELKAVNERMQVATDARMGAEAQR